MSGHRTAFASASIAARASATMLAGMLLWAPAAAAVQAVFLVRHAEKESQTDPDTALAIRGEDRALALSRLLRNAGITHIVTTELRRTQQTAAPLAALTGVTPTVIPAKDRAAAIAHIKALPKDAVVLLVGHSNTLPDIAKGLGAKTPVQLKDEQYGRVFLVLTDGGVIELAY
jgi:phosphohistidine phosphatase SixA